MNKLDELIEKLCPNGVKFERLGNRELFKFYYGKGNKIPEDVGGIYDVYGANGVVSHINKYNCEDVSIIGHIGAVGMVNRCKEKCFVTYNGTIAKVVDKTKVNSQYLYYVLTTLNLPAYKKGNQPFLSVSDFDKICIPIPPMKVQNEIVHILDDFTLLSAELLAELSAELKARQKQYEYYCNKLLKLENEEKKTLKDVTNNISSGKNKERLTNGIYPVYGSTGIISSTNNAVYEKEQILIARVGANAGYVHIAIGSYDVSDNTLIVDLQQNVNMKYVYYQLSNMNLHQYAKGGGQPLITAGEMKQISIPVPKIEKQNEIVEILDKFYKMITDISEGLSAEIEARRKQYEYYRDKLLRFKELKVEN